MDSSWVSCYTFMFILFFLYFTRGSVEVWRTLSKNDAQISVRILKQTDENSSCLETKPSGAGERRRCHNRFRHGHGRKHRAPIIDLWFFPFGVERTKRSFVEEELPFKIGEADRFDRIAAPDCRGLHGYKAKNRSEATPWLLVFNGAQSQTLRPLSLSLQLNWRRSWWIAHWKLVTYQPHSFQKEAELQKEAGRKKRRVAWSARLSNCMNFIG